MEDSFDYNEWTTQQLDEFEQGKLSASGQQLAPRPWPLPRDYDTRFEALREGLTFSQKAFISNGREAGCEIAELRTAACAYGDWMHRLIGRGAPGWKDRWTPGTADDREAFGWVGAITFGGYIQSATPDPESGAWWIDPTANAFGVLWQKWPGPACYRVVSGLYAVDRALYEIGRDEPGEAAAWAMDVAERCQWLNDAFTAQARVQIQAQARREQASRGGKKRHAPTDAAKLHVIEKYRSLRATGDARKVRPIARDLVPLALETATSAGRRMNEEGAFDKVYRWLLEAEGISAE